MNQDFVNKLIDKYIENECTEQEIRLLNTYLDSFQDKQVELFSGLRYDEEIKEQLWAKIESEIEIRNEKATFSFKKYLKYAAVFIGLLTSFFWYHTKNDKAVEQVISIPLDEVIVLRTSDNRLIELNSEGGQVLLDRKGGVLARQNGNQIKYDEKGGNNELVYNEILVPNGKRFQVVLSDGTLVHINSGSSLKYPVNFVAGNPREVFLKGEAYFDVTKNTDSPFLVTTDEIGVTVLGTKFNVSSYPEDSYVNTVLVEGSVSLSNNDGSGKGLVLDPGYKAEWDVLNKQATVEKVDTNIYTGWIYGRLVLKGLSFNNIIKKLERHYDVTIINNYTELDGKVFTASFDVETIEEVLNSFIINKEFEFQIKDKIITINKP